jgi:hypothetical protein
VFWLIAAGTCKLRKSYIKYLKILPILLDQELFIELLNEIHLLIPMEKVVEELENCTILNRKNLQRN